MRKLTSIVLLGLLALFTVGAAPAAHAQAGQRCFPETDHCISGPIRQYWERNGGLAVFGYPIGEQRVETVEGRTIPVQWFERDRLEIQLDGTVTAGRLGARVLELQGRRWEIRPRAEPQPPESGCRYFVETGHNLCWPFRQYWEQNGGLERFGYPITELHATVIQGKAMPVQYFERRRMEHHQDLAGTPYEVLLGLLSREIEQVQGLSPCQGAVRDVQLVGMAERVDNASFRNVLYCPTESYTNLPAAVQDFEGGKMFWVDLGPAGRKVIVYRHPGRWMDVQTYMVYDDTWREGDPPITEPAPPYRLVPQHGFGKVWAGGERTWLGYAVSTEQPDRAFVQYFGGGGFALYLQGANQVWVFGPELTHAESW